MLQDKRTDLIGEKRRALIRRLVDELAAQSPDFYYHPTHYVAELIERHVKKSPTFTREDQELLRPLSRKDIEVLLSLH